MEYPFTHWQHENSFFDNSKIIVLTHITKQPQHDGNDSLLKHTHTHSPQHQRSRPKIPGKQTYYYYYYYYYYYKYEPTITVIKVKTMNTLWYDPGSSQC